MKALSKTDIVIRLGRLNKVMKVLKCGLSYNTMHKRRLNLEQIVRRETQMYIDSNGHLKRLV